MPEVGIIIAKCPLCGKKYYGFSVEEANERYEKLHDCKIVKEIEEIPDRCLRESKE